MSVLLCASWTSGPDRHLGSRIQVQVIASLNVDRTSTCAGANYRTDRRTFATAGNRADEGADRRTNRSACGCLLGLVAVTNRTFVIDPHDFTIGVRTLSRIPAKR